MKQEMEAMNDLAKAFFKEADSFLSAKRNVNNAPEEDNAINELHKNAVKTQLDYDLRSIAINSLMPFSEVKRLFRCVLDVKKVSKIIKVGESLNVDPFDIEKILKEFKDE